MEKLPHRTNKLLKKINRLKHFDITVSNTSDIVLLADRSYVKFHRAFSPESLNENSDWMSYLTITPKGKIYLATLRDENIKFFIPLILSNLMALVAVAISIVSLLMQK